MAGRMQRGFCHRLIVLGVESTTHTQRSRREKNADALFKLSDGARSGSRRRGRSLVARGAGAGGDHGRPGAGRLRYLVVADVRPRLPRPAFRGARPDHAGQHGPPAPGMGVRHRRREPRPAGDAAGARGRDLPLGRRVARVRHRRPDRREEVGFRAGDVGRGRAGLLLRIEQPGRGAVRRSRLRRHDGRAADRAPQGHRRRRVGGRGHRLAAGLQHHRGAARGQRPGHDRRGRRRVRHSRLRQGVRRAERRAAVDDVHHPRSGGARQRDVAGRHLEERRRPHLDDGRLRSRAEPHLLEHR